MRVALYGGTFNPPHIGHLLTVKTLSETFDRVIVMPAAIPPHKPLPENSFSAAERLELSRLTFGGFNNVEVSDLEINKNQICYTIDTMDALDIDDLTLVIGTDMLLSLEEWYRFEDILKRAKIAVLRRDGRSVTEHIDHLITRYNANVTLIDTNIVEISSTQLRLTGALSIQSPVPAAPPPPEGVFRGNGGVASGQAPCRAKASADAGTRAPVPPYPRAARLKILKTIHPKRLAHSLGAESEAIRLAEHYGADAKDAALAALLHDCTKHWTVERHLQYCEECNIITNKAFSDIPKLLHSVTAAELARREFQVSDSVYGAIRHHTVGRCEMSELELIVYLADKLEPTREYKDVPGYREIAYESLERATLAIMEMSIRKLMNEGRTIHPATIEARNYYLEVLTL